MSKSDQLEDLAAQLRSYGIDHSLSSYSSYIGGEVYYLDCGDEAIVLWRKIRSIFVD
jgi:hypothetical protein